MRTLNNWVRKADWGFLLFALAFVLALGTIVYFDAKKANESAAMRRDVSMQLELEFERLDLTVIGPVKSHYNTIQTPDGCRVELITGSSEGDVHYVYIDGSFGVSWPVDEQLPDRLEALCDTMRVPEAEGGS